MGESIGLQSGINRVFNEIQFSTWKGVVVCFPVEHYMRTWSDPQKTPIQAIYSKQVLYGIASFHGIQIELMKWNPSFLLALLLQCNNVLLTGVDEYFHCNYPERHMHMYPHY